MIGALRSTAGIVSIGAAVPERIVTNDELSGRIDTCDAWIRAAPVSPSAGGRTRRVGLRPRASPPRSRRSTAPALAPADIDFVVAATCSPDSYFPSIAAIIADGLGAHSAAAQRISAACTGWVYALMDAVSQIRVRPRAARARGGRRDALEGRRLGRPRDLHPVRRRRGRLRDVGRRAARDGVRAGARSRRLARQRPDRRSAPRQERDRDGRRRRVPVRDVRDGRLDQPRARRLRPRHRATSIGSCRTRRTSGSSTMP